MLSKTLQLLAQDLGLRVEENRACGIYEGYMISLYEAKGMTPVSVDAIAYVNIEKD